MKDYLEEYGQFLIHEKHMSENSLLAYRRDLREFQQYIREKGLDGLDEVLNTHVVSFVLFLKTQGRSAATVNRKVASVRAFYNFMNGKGYVTANPVFNIKSPRIERKEIEYLSLEEVEAILSLPDMTPRGRRDKGILELMYATGIRVTEVIELKISDLNLRMGFVTCSGEHGTARIVPIGIPAKEALEDYIENHRDKLLKEGNNTDNQVLFLNYAGDKITRQGMWKILREYAVKAEKIYSDSLNTTEISGWGSKITPQTLRNSFAVHMLQNGADIKSLQELMGHEDLAAMEIYLSAVKNRIKDVYDRCHPRALKSNDDGQ